jgi:hypothetical protein
MPTNRVYTSNAERQKAYRLRHAARLKAPPEPRTRRRQTSRPARLAALLTAVEELQQEYETWRDSLPESLRESEQADRLTETIEQLETVGELLSQIQPPKGFGRD